MHDAVVPNSRRSLVTLFDGFLSQIKDSVRNRVKNVHYMVQSFVLKIISILMQVTPLFPIDDFVAAL